MHQILVRVMNFALLCSVLIWVLILPAPHPLPTSFSKDFPHLLWLCVNPHFFYWCMYRASNASMNHFLLKTYAKTSYQSMHMSHEFVSLFGSLVGTERILVSQLHKKSSFMRENSVEIKSTFSNGSSSFSVLHNWNTLSEWCNSSPWEYALIFSPIRRGLKFCYPTEPCT